MPTTTTGVATTFIDFTRASNATVTDSDGRVKWAPHNLLLASESFDAAAWGSKAYVTANAAVAPNGTTTADRINNTGAADNVAQTATVSPGVAYTFSFWAKNNGGTTASYRVYDNTNFADIVAVTSYFSLINGSTWTQITVTFTAPAGCTTANCYVSATNGPTNNIFVWGASLYRSDLAMQPNTSAYPMYNPTTPKNLLGYTEDFSNAAWTKANIAAFGSGSVSNAILAPNGLQTADKVVASNSASATRAIYQNITPVSGCTYVMSVYARAAEYDKLAIQDISAGRFGVSFDLTAQTATSLGGAGYVSSAITPVDNSWFRCSVVWTASGAVAATIIGYPTGATVSAAGTSYAGDGTSGIYLWGAQLSDSASLDSYVPVYGAAVTSAAYYGPRRDFDPVTLACKGLLVEEQRANLLTYSAQFDNAAWTPTGATIAANVAGATAVAPDGTNTADKLVESNTTADHYLSRVSATQAIGTKYTLSWYVKASGRTKIRLYAYAMNNLAVFYDTATNTASYVSGGTNYSFSMSDAGSGWYRCVATSDASATNNDFAINLVSTGTTVNYAGDGTSGVLLWGAQLEAGSFATSYIPVGATTAGATRNADVASVSTQAFPYSATEGTLVANGSVLSTAAGNRGAFTLASAGGYIAIGNNVSGLGATNADFYTLPAGTFLTASGAVTAGTPFKAAAVYKASDFALSANGAAAVTSSSGALPTAATDAYIGRSGSSSLYFNGHIRQITYLPRRISNAELQTRTS